MDTPTFYHETVLLKEAVDGLNIRPDGIYADATFGGGGHSREILSRLGDSGKLFAFDQDADAWKNIPEDRRLIPVKENFRYLKRFLKLHQHPETDGILADLGVSSYQFDTGERGFSTRFDGPLDMRMDQRSEKTAAEVLKNYSEKQLHQIFEQYGEVRNSRQLAKQIASRRNSGNLNTIEGFKALIQPVMRGNPRKYLAQVFQALRIEVNDELDALKDLLKQAAECLKPEGRICIITFHSIEDRIVKQFFKNGHWENPFSVNPAQNEKEPWILKEVNKKPIEPSAEEIKNNPRSRSARLRIAERRVQE